MSVNLLPREAYLWHDASFFLLVFSATAATCLKVVEAWAAQLLLQREQTFPTQTTPAAAAAGAGQDREGKEGKKKNAKS